ncbi:hypothetical protein WMY93_017010 [Mugilogobius chulae]|uniref:Uncharacterized protein n=1 Tax=Mugilogobius chulae TaxID=88201 RepID=A0AAW0NN83_9GOBI
MRRISPPPSLHLRPQSLVCAHAEAEPGELKRKARMTHGWAVPYYQLQEENQDEGTGVQGASKEKLTRHKHRGVQDPGWSVT